MALPSTASLDLDLARLSLSSPYSQAPQQQQGQQPQPQSQHGYPILRQHTPASASSSLERPSSSSLQIHHLQQQQQQQQQQGLAPHQIMQPPLHAGPPPHVQLQEPQRRRGVVKFFNSLKGFGFVVDNDPAALGGQEVFCHFSAISGKGGFRSLAEGEEVEYELVQGPKGFQAANLTGPGGRTVVGDPKARMQKPPQYLPFAPMALPLGGPYLADPYHAQHGAVYAGSPYTSHVLYVPASAALPPSQYAYAPVPLQAAPPQQGRGGPPPPSGNGANGAGGTSPFAAPQYQSYAAPSGGVGAGGPLTVGPAPGAGADRYSSLTRIGAATGAYGAPAPGGERGYPQQQQGGGPAGFSPPGGGQQYVGLPPGSPPGGASGGGGASNGGAGGAGGGFGGGFAPFSPPSFNSHPSLFGAPPPAQAYYAMPGPQDAYPVSSSNGQQQQQQQQQQYQPQQPPQQQQRATTPSSALFGTIPAPIGSRSGTPIGGGAAGGRSTPALGNGNLGSDAWRNAGSPAGSAVL